MPTTRHHHHNRPPKILRFPQENYIDKVRWIPTQTTPLQKHIALSTFNPQTSTPSLQLHSYSATSSLLHHSTYTPPSRITSLQPTTPPNSQTTLIVIATIAGSLQVLSFDDDDKGVDLVVEEKSLHCGEVKCVDVLGDECVSVGDDGRVCLFKVKGGGIERVFEEDGNGLVEYNAVKWASGFEFVTAGFGFGLQWWDRRKPGGPASQLKGSWADRKASGMVHSIDIHPSRKHTCVAGGSLGTIFAWDLRWQQQPIALSGIGMGEGAIQSPSESEVWEVRYDHYTKSSNISSVSSSRILPVMFCSEDGILGVLDQGAEPVELLAEPCAINSFDIDRQNPSDVICSLEWESVAILVRP